MLQPIGSQRIGHDLVTEQRGCIHLSSVSSMWLWAPWQYVFPLFWALSTVPGMKEAVHNYVKKEGVQEEHIPLDQSNYRAWSLTPGLLSQPTYSWHPHLHPPPCHHCSPCVRAWWNFWHLFLSISNERSLCNKTAPFSHKDVAVFPSVFSNTVAYISINAHSKLNWGQWSLFFSITNVYQ